MKLEIAWSGGNTFQSTPLREGRHKVEALKKWLAAFQSTPLREGRPF